MKYFIDLIYRKSQFPINFIFFLSLILGFLLKTPLSFAQTDFYIYPAEDFSLRTGAGYEYPIVHSSISSGTRVKIISVDDDKLWSKVTTDDEKSGWIENQYISKNKASISELKLAQRRIEVLNDENDKLRRQVNTFKTEQKNLSLMVSSSKKEYLSVSEELAQLRQISKNTMTIDKLNNELMKQKENLLAKVATLDSENNRLNEKLKNQSFIQGAFAVLLGVIICMIVLKFSPGSRRKNGWV